jgi:hypothetical protein
LATESKTVACLSIKPIKLLYSKASRSFLRLVSTLQMFLLPVAISKSLKSGLIFCLKNFSCKETWKNKKVCLYPSCATARQQILQGANLASLALSFCLSLKLCRKSCLLWINSQNQLSKTRRAGRLMLKQQRTSKSTMDRRVAQLESWRRKCVKVTQTPTSFRASLK